MTGAWVQGYGSSGLLTPPNDPRISNTITTLTDTNQASKQEFDYDGFSNKTEVREYDFGANGQPGTLLRKSHTSYVVSNGGVDYTTVNPNTTNPDLSQTVHLRSLPLHQWVYDGPTGSLKAQTDYEYDTYTQGLTDRSDISGHARTLDNPPAYTSSYMTRGNVTAQTRWELPSTQRTTRMQYDIAGNVWSVTDPKNNPPTLFDFSDHYGVPDNEARDNSQYKPELGSQVTYAFATLVTNALGHTAYTQYDYYLGKPVNGEDANGVVAKGSYNDLLDRSTDLDVGMFSGSQIQRHTSFIYNDASHLITTQSDQTTLNDGVLTSTIVYDGLGRTTETRTTVPEGTIYTIQQYDALGRVKHTTNPYLTTGEPTYGYADTAYDGLGRVRTVTTADGAVVTTTYSDNVTTVTDQAGKSRRSITDGLGRLIRVDEPNSSGSLGTVPSPTQPTSYVYDVLDDLTSVTQGGQTRTFVYDSLKRLKQATNPESGAVNYTYDANSNLLTKQDARLITTTYAYDALNRVISRTYTGDPQSTPQVNYYYDSSQGLPANKPPSFTPANAKGRLIAVCYGGPTSSAGDYQRYDELGRVTASYQQTDLNNYGFSYGYNLASEMTSETYPSGRQIVTQYDSAGRVAGVKNPASGLYYAGATSSDATNRIQYAPQGAVSVMKLGNGKWEHTNFNNRLQPTQIGLGTSSGNSSVLELDYTYGTTSNNGNVLSQTITLPGLTVNQCYTYDWLNRLSTAEEKSGGTTCAGTQQWKQAFTYDRFGNRNFDVVNTTANVLGPNPTISQSSNRIASGQGYGYDNAGNLTSDPTTPVNGIVYDAENRQTQYTKSQQATNYYYYDGEGHRVKKIDSSGTTVFVYNVGDQLIAEYTSGTPSGGGTSYLTSDHLGSTRVVMKSDGSAARHDYLPFGEEISSTIGGRGGVPGYGAMDSTRQRFTQKERDGESGLDYFGARYYSSAQGRFTSPDPLMASARTVNPQTWNRFVYVINNPLRYVDPSGMEEKDAWGQLNEEEQKIIRGKLANRTVTENGQKRRETDQEAFNRLVGNSTNRSSEQIAQFVTGIKNFIDNAGGHENSSVWQAIHFIEGGWVGTNNSVGIEISTDRGFLDTLRNSGQYDVDRGYEKANLLADHLHSARFITGSDPLSTSMHMVQEKGQEPATIYSDPRFFVHWDSGSVAYRAKWWQKPVTPLVDAVNGISHEFSHPSATETRRQLTFQHIVPKNER